ncbi:hypothetical protein [Amphritea sp.]|uniref:hypothetical protein n=1 Tax=Amphritea sp. TaxID=1872502 RepID=UPI003D137FC0
MSKVIMINILVVIFFCFFSCNSMAVDLCDDQHLKSRSKDTLELFKHKISTVIDVNIGSRNSLIVDAVVFNNQEYFNDIKRYRSEEILNALFFAVALDRRDWIYELLKYNVRLDDIGGQVIPFFGAAYGNCIDSLKIAIDLDVDFSLRDRNGMTFAEVAMLNKSTEVLKFYIDRAEREEIEMLKLSSSKYDRLDWLLALINQQ